MLQNLTNTENNITSLQLEKIILLAIPIVTSSAFNTHSEKQ